MPLRYHPKALMRRGRCHRGKKLRACDQSYSEFEDAQYCRSPPCLASHRVSMVVLSLVIRPIRSYVSLFLPVQAKYSPSGVLCERYNVTIRRSVRPYGREVHKMRDNWDSISMSHIGGQYFPDIPCARSASNVLVGVPVRAMSDARRAVTTGFAAANIRLAVHPGLAAL